jgi:hypothetical protein
MAGLRHRYDQAVAAGISANLSRRWHKGNHPGLILAWRLRRKAAQVWLFASRFDVPATNNVAVIRSPVRVHAGCVSRSHLAPRRQCLTEGLRMSGGREGPRQAKDGSEESCETAGAVA